MTRLPPHSLATTATPRSPLSTSLNPTLLSCETELATVGFADSSHDADTDVRTAHPNPCSKRRLTITSLIPPLVALLPRIYAYLPRFVPKTPSALTISIPSSPRHTPCPAEPRRPSTTLHNPPLHPIPGRRSTLFHRLSPALTRHLALPIEPQHRAPTSRATCGPRQRFKTSPTSSRPRFAPTRSKTALQTNPNRRRACAVDPFTGRRGRRTGRARENRHRERAPAALLIPSPTSSCPPIVWQGAPASVSVARRQSTLTFLFTDDVSTGFNVNGARHAAVR
ncbi:hypothetical protein R3P38DRAFT_2902332 [Favolaschia claudopus]|uniref:Uncharacterized protein n=1 Tax=Favolaschia claudopus TaxID=2862362 RepID=A0AAW0CK02_9AGAR